MTRSTIGLTIAAATAIFAVGCGENPPAQDPSTAKATSYETAQNPAPTSPFETATGLPHEDKDKAATKVEEPAPAPAPVAETITDGHILEVVKTANTGEIEQAKLAKTKSKDARVKKYADMMVKEHSDASAKTDALAKKAGIEPKSSTASSALATDAKETSTALSSQTGKEFDKAYIDAQVKAHQTVLETIEGKLLPAAQNADVKTHLESVRGKVTHHLAEAKEIQKQLAK